MRLTTKCDSDEYIVGVTTNGGYDEDAVLEKQHEANNKLGKLEDLEEELGCPLEVVFKALENGAYLEIKGNTISDSDMVYHKNVSVVKNEIQFQRTDESCIYINRRLKDYKKTWWLNKDKSE